VKWVEVARLVVVMAMEEGIDSFLFYELNVVVDYAM